MKQISSLIAGLCALVCTTANAATLTSLQTRSEPGSAVFSVYVNGESLNGDFDTIIFDALPGAGLQFSTVNTGSPASPRLPGDPSTFINRMLDQDPSEVPGALGYTRLGVVSTPDRIAFTAGPLGGKITTPDVPGLFLANFLNPAPVVSTATVQLVNAGTIVYQSTISINIIPEPTSAALAGLALLGLALARRPLARHA